MMMMMMMMMTTTTSTTITIKYLFKQFHNYKNNNHKPNKNLHSSTAGTIPFQGPSFAIHLFPKNWAAFPTSSPIKQVTMLSITHTLCRNVIT